MGEGGESDGLRKLHHQDLREAYRLASQNFLSMNRKSRVTTGSPLSTETPVLLLLSLF